MSILADRKRKQKWSILEGNINKNNDWSKDSNKFGQKMLERMGWQEGKGLGRNEDGETSHVKVALKNNMKGMGFKDSVEWSAQQDNFHELLNELNNERTGHDKPTQSLEAKSQQSRARVHYRKFTRGKDLSRCSEKDLANIFGKKKLQNEVKIEEKVEEEVKQEGSGMLKVAGSMVDYFKNKSFKFNSGKERESEDEVERVGFGFQSSQETKSKKKRLKGGENTFVSYVGEEDTSNKASEGGEVEEKPRKAKKRKGEDQEAPDKCLGVSEVPSKKLKFEESPIKSRKKEKSKKGDLGLINPAFEPLGVNISMERHALETINECESEELNDFVPKKKKKKRKSGLEDTEGLNVKEDHNEEFFNKKNKLEEDEFENHSTKKSRRKKFEESESKTPKKLKNIPEGLDNPMAELNDSNVENTSVAATPNAFEVKRKKKKKGMDNSSNDCRGVDNPALNLNDSGIKLPENGLDNPALNLNLSDQSENITPKSKKKKKKGIENLALNIDDSVQSLDTPNGFEVKRKKKKGKVSEQDEPNKVEVKKKKKSEVEAEQQQQNVENVEEPEDCDLILNIVDERVKKMKQHKKSAEDILKRNELFEINNKVIRNGLKSRSKRGIDNQGFNRIAQNVEESVNKLTSSLDNYQAEVENGINESKDKKPDEARTMEEIFIGEDEATGQDEGVRLKFKDANFNKRQPAWVSKNDALNNVAKKSYRHLIKGDVILKFNNTNLDCISGYGNV